MAHLLNSRLSPTLLHTSLIFNSRFNRIVMKTQIKCFYTSCACQSIVSIFCCCCSVAQSCQTLCNPMDCSLLACQASLSLTISQSLSKFMFITSVMSSSHLIPWCSLLLQPSIFPSIKDFSNESSVLIRWPKYWSFSFSINLSREYSGLISLKTDWLDSLLSKALSGAFSSTTLRRHQFFGVLPSLRYSSHNHTWPLRRAEPWLYRPLSAE